MRKEDLIVWEEHIKSTKVDNDVVIAETTNDTLVGYVVYKCKKCKNRISTKIKNDYIYYFKSICPLCNNVKKYTIINVNSV